MDGGVIQKGGEGGLFERGGGLFKRGGRGGYSKGGGVPIRGGPPPLNNPPHPANERVWGVLDEVMKPFLVLLLSAQLQWDAAHPGGIQAFEACIELLGPLS